MAEAEEDGGAAEQDAPTRKAQQQQHDHDHDHDHARNGAETAIRRLPIKEEERKSEKRRGKKTKW